MGADLDYRTYENKSESEVRSLFAKACEEARHESGHGGYTGTIAEMNGVASFAPIAPFATAHEAEDYLTDNHEKWEDALAVPFSLPLPRDERQQERVDELTERAAMWRDRVRKAQSDAVDNFRGRKAVTVGCSGCKSRLDHERLAAKAHMAASLCCPVCHTSLLSKPDQQRISKLQARVEKVNAELTEARVPQTNGKLGWIVGGWCSS